MKIHESSRYFGSYKYGSLGYTKKDFHKNLHDRLKCYSEKYPSGEKISGPKICYIKNFNRFAYFNFIKTYQVKLQHRKIISSLFKKYNKFRPIRLISIKLLDKDKKLLKGRTVGGSYFSADIWDRYDGATPNKWYKAKKDFLKELYSLPASDMVPSRIINDEREFYMYDTHNNIHEGFVLDIKKNGPDFYTLYTNKFENTIFMYLSEDDVAKLNDISLNHNIRCADDVIGVWNSSWRKFRNNQRVQNDLCSDLF